MCPCEAETEGCSDSSIGSQNSQYALPNLTPSSNSETIPIVVGHVSTIHHLHPLTPNRASRSAF